MSKRPTYQDLEEQIGELKRELKRLKEEFGESVKVLKESERRFAAIFDSSPVPTSLTRLSDNQLVDFNPAMMELTGYSRPEIVGKSATGLNLYADPETRAKLFVELRNRGVVRGFEFQIRNRSREIRDLLYSGVLIPLGNQPHLLSMAVDITERKRMEAALIESEEALRGQKELLEEIVQQRTQALEESERYFRRLASSVPAAFARVDSEGRYTFVNRTYEAWCGLPSAEISGKHLREVLGAKAWEAIKGHTEAALSGERRSYEAEVPHAHGATRWVRAECVPDFDEWGEQTGVFFSATDITAKKQAEFAMQRLLEENRLLSRRVLAVQEEERRYLARELHDEMGQNLIALMFQIRLFRDGHEASDERLASLKKIEQVTARMADSLKQVLERLRPQMLDQLGVVTAVGEAIERWRFRHSDIACDFAAIGSFENLEEDVAIAIYRIVQECLTNVEKHAAASKVTIHLGNTDQVVQLTLRDNGRGMDLNKSRKGLGMLGMRERAESLDGVFEVRSSPSQGTEVFVTIPLPAPPVAVGTTS
ncbi:PAS domain S-box [Thioflavicoccus mobilis 8321]|uniref:PAS domain S-box n=1 Tax=Thioflavicoccus mobilis 8321 TaxID=765912 RepID=L0GVB3_9GAMM|nr:PAS domain S-box protein [Thioflavicoccus mobilis]AGA89239.1 PAS domain S-box [Thioflavicoccus mobilis 8321]